MDWCLLEKERNPIWWTNLSEKKRISYLDLRCSLFADSYLVEDEMKIQKDYDGGWILATYTHETCFGFDWRDWKFERLFWNRRIYSIQIGIFYFVRREWRLK